MEDEVRVQYEGFRPGMYVRVEIPALPCEFVTNFDPHYPIILGGLGASEGNVGYLQVSLSGLIWTIVYFTTSGVVDNLVNKVKDTCDSKPNVITRQDLLKKFWSFLYRLHTDASEETPLAQPHLENP